jgi:hypothetical protein
LPGIEILPEIIAHHLFGQAQILQEGCKSLLVEFAVSARCARNFQDFLIDQLLTDRDAIILAEDGERIAVDDLLQRRIQPAALDEPPHIKRRVLPPLRA